MKQIVISVQNHLAEQVSALKYVDQDWGQMDFYEHAPLKFPAALIDVQNVEYSDAGELIQYASVTVVIRLFDLRMGGSSTKATDDAKERAGKIWQLIEDVNRVMHGQSFIGRGYGRFMRRQLRRSKRSDGCYQTELVYTIQFTDESCRVERERVGATPAIAVARL